jgi:hypothetical protein
MPDEIRDEREYTREEMREACRNNYNAALLEARIGGIEEGINGIGLALRYQSEMLAQLAGGR